MASERAPATAEVNRRAVLAELGQLRVAIPAVVTKWDASKQLADCKPLVKDFATDEEDQRVAESVPVVSSCPVVFPGGKLFRLTFPISDGNLVIGGSTVPATTGLLVFSERSIDRWLSGQGDEVDPEFDHRHHLADAIFFPGLNTSANPLGDVPTDHCTLGVDGGLQIHFRKDVIAIGDEAGNDWISLAQKVTDTLNRLQTVLNALFAASVTPVNEPGNGAPSALQIAMQAAFSAANITDGLLPHTSTWPDNTAASQAKAK